MIYYTINQKLNQQPATSNQQLELITLHPIYNLRYKVETN